MATPVLHGTVSLGYVTDVTDDTFASAVMERSHAVPVVVDLWAEWCGPCRTLGPILEKVIDETNGAVELAKVDIDANPQIAQAFKVQSIPAVFAIQNGQIIDSFVGALPEPAIRDFLKRLNPAVTATSEVVAEVDEASLRRTLEMDPANLDAAVTLADLLRQNDQLDEAEKVLESFASNLAAKTVLARVGLQRRGVSLSDDIDGTLNDLLARSSDETVRTQLLEVLDALGPDDARYVTYRRRLANQLY